MSKVDRRSIEGSIGSIEPCPHLLPCTSESKKLLLELGCPDDPRSILHKAVKPTFLSKVQRKAKKWRRSLLFALSC